MSLVPRMAWLRLKPPIAARGGVVEVGAAGALQQIAADGSFVVQLTRGSGQQRLGEDRVACSSVAIGGEVGIGRLGADPEPTVRLRLNRLQGQPADIDQMGRPLDLELHQVEQIGAAADVGSAGFGRGDHRGGRVDRPLVGEGPHRRAPSPTERMTATMLG
jgi:hypothetical protein